MRPILLLLLYITPLLAPAQSPVEQILQSVARNNPTLRAQEQVYAARRAQLRTGLAPENPFAEYDYLPGRPEGTGIQQEFSVTQSLDFPTAYTRRRTLAQLQSAQTGPQQRVGRQQLLLEAKRLCLELIYHNIRRQDLQRRLQRATQLAAGVREQVRQGTATALDVSKADLHRLGIEHELRQNELESHQQRLRLTELNGGQAVSLSDTLYPAMPTLPPFAQLDSLIEAGDPAVVVVRQQVTVDQQQLALTRALTLPKLQVGYHYQSLLGVRYQGIHAGLSIPLWQQRRTVQASQAALVAAESQVVAHRAEHQARNQRLYEQLQGLQTSLTQYRQALAATQTVSLLETSFRLRQITTVAFLLEMTYLYGATDTLRQIERDLQLTAAELWAFQL